LRLDKTLITAQVVLSRLPNAKLRRLIDRYFPQFANLSRGDTMKRFAHALTGIVLLCTPTVGVVAETYPERPVRLIVPSTAGSGLGNGAARVLAQKLTENLGRTFFVENIPGGGTNIGMATAARAKPDGHTVLIAVSTLMVNPLIYAKVPYDPIRDFAPITLLGVSNFVLVVNPQVPAKDAAGLMALIRANPGKYNFASPGFGTTPHLLGELLRISLDLDLVHVPFNGGGPAINSTLAGSTPILFSPPSIAIPLVEAGRLRALAVTSKERLAELPDVPTVAEAGLPGEGADTMVGVLVPAGTPREIIDLLHREIIKITAMPDVRERFAAFGLTPASNTPEEFGAYIKAEIARWGKVIHDGNIGTE
jgi:tripartite-type tricarboxylate transporter receptor subunit TctC